MKRYIIQFDTNNESFYTPRTLYVPCGEPIQILFRLKDFANDQYVTSINLRNAGDTSTKTCDDVNVNFYIPQSEGYYHVSSFTFEDGIKYDTEISGVITTEGALEIPFTNVIVKPVEPDSISYVDVGGNGDDIQCDNITCNNIITVTDGTDTTTITKSGICTTNVNCDEIMIGATSLTEQELTQLLALIQNN